MHDILLLLVLLFAGTGFTILSFVHQKDMRRFSKAMRTRMRKHKERMTSERFTKEHFAQADDEEKAAILVELLGDDHE